MILAAILIALPLVFVDYARNLWLSDGQVRGTIDRADGAVYDTGLMIRAGLLRALHRVPKATSSIVLVEYDDETEAYYREHYSNAWLLYADTVTKIAEAKPKAVFVDYLYFYNSGLAQMGHDLRDIIGRTNAADRLSPAENERLKAIEDSLAAADRFNVALKSTRTYLPANCLESAIPFDSAEEEQTDIDRIRRGWAIPADSGAFPVVGGMRFVYPIESFLDASAGPVQSCEMKDPDNVLRRDLPFVSVVRKGVQYYVPNSTVVVAALAMGLTPKDLHLEASGFRLGDHFIPVDHDGRIPYAVLGGRYDFRNRAVQRHPNTFSAVALLKGAVDPQFLKDKVVLFGETHSATADKKHTPLTSSDSASFVPGVELIAGQADALTQPQFPLEMPFWLGRFGFLLSLATLGFGILVGQYVDPRRPATLAAGVLGILAVPLAALTIFVFGGIWLRPLIPTLAAVVAAAVGIGDASIKIRRERQFVEDAFGRLVSPEIVKEILGRDELPELGGEDRQEITILFADLRGFTSKSEQLPVAEMMSLLNEHLDEMTRIIRKHGGTLDKFIGDCVMAFWGAPLPDPDHALHACEAGLEMLLAVEQANERRRAEGRMELAIGVGINTGRVRVGMMGAKDKLDYTVIGDPVNLASRFEGMTKETGYGALVGQTTAEAVSGRIAVDPLGGLKVKGKAAPVPVFGLRETRKLPATSAASG